MQPRRIHLARGQMQDLAIKKNLFLHDPAKFLQDPARFTVKHFPARISLTIKKDLFWRNLAG